MHALCLVVRSKTGGGEKLNTGHICDLLENEPKRAYYFLAKKCFCIGIEIYFRLHTG